VAVDGGCDGFGDFLENVRLLAHVDYFLLVCLGNSRQSETRMRSLAVHIGLHAKYSHISLSQVRPDLLVGAGLVASSAEDREHSDYLDSGTRVDFISQVPGDVEKESPGHVTCRNILRHLLQLENLLVHVSALFADCSVSVQLAGLLVSSGVPGIVAGSGNLHTVETRRQVYLLLVPAVAALDKNSSGLHVCLSRRNYNSRDYHDPVRLLSSQLSEGNGDFLGVEAKLEVRQVLGFH